MLGLLPSRDTMCEHGGGRERRMYYDLPEQAFVPPPELGSAPPTIIHPIVIVGGGPVGLTLALALAAQGQRAIVLEDDSTVSEGSRALGMSKRTLEIWEALGAVAPVVARGLAWSGGRIYRGTRLVSAFDMPVDADQPHGPMTNIQQCWADQALLDALRQRYKLEPRWRSRCTGVVPAGDHVTVRVSCPAGEYELAARFVVACDGARSVVRSALGLRMEGSSATATYVIADIRADLTLPVCRHAWFDPPSLPRGATVLMHKQPDEIWRIDYQIGDTDQLAEHLRPEVVTDRIRAHLESIGEATDFSLEWISSYQARKLTLPSYRAGRVLFAGDAAHLVPIFGIRGLNSGVEDAFTLAWRLARVIEDKAPIDLLDGYSQERVAAARENIAQAGRSAAIMDPPTRGARLMRDAVLALAPHEPALSDILNPRQGRTVAATSSPLNAFPDRSAELSSGPAPGEVLPDVRLNVPSQAGDTILPAQMLCAPRAFTLFLFDPDEALKDAARHAAGALGIVLRIVRPKARVPAEIADDVAARSFAERLGAGPGSAYLVRPDHLVCARWRRLDVDELARAMGRMGQDATEIAHAD